MTQAPCDNKQMKPGLRFIRKLLIFSPLLVIFCLFENFDDNKIFEQLPTPKKEETKVLSSTTLSSAAEEVFLTQYAPEARAFSEKIGEQFRFGFDDSQYMADGTDQQHLRPEMSMQVIGQKAGHQGARVEVVNADRVRMAWGDSPVSCEFSPISQTLRLRTPLMHNTSNLQYEHQGKDNQDRLSLQISW